MTQWWSVNWKNRSHFALRHPVYTFKAIIRDLLAADERFLASLTETTASRIRHFLDEPFQERRFFDHLRDAESQLNRVQAIGADLYAKRVLLQYAIARAYKPDCIVETGVANGVSSAYLLLALERNQKGSLYSIDVGDGSFLPAGKTTGWIVPDWLRERWMLHLGDAREILPQVLKHLGSLDVFIHDSLHTYEHMKFEYEQAYPYLRPGGILVSDDALWNSAFSEFARNVVPSSARVIRGIGILQKQTQ
jgi:predicted O-methyltransferase YrrM